MPNHYGDKKTGKAVLDGEVVKFKEGGLRNQLKVPKDHTFTKNGTYEDPKSPRRRKILIFRKRL